MFVKIIKASSLNYWYHSVINAVFEVTDKGNKVGSHELLETEYNINTLKELYFHNSIYSNPKGCSILKQDFVKVKRNGFNSKGEQQWKKVVPLRKNKPSDKHIQVIIIKAKYNTLWYKNYINRIFDVKSYDENNYELLATERNKNILNEIKGISNYLIKKSDCTVNNSTKTDAFFTLSEVKARINKKIKTKELDLLTIRIDNVFQKNGYAFPNKTNLCKAIAMDMQSYIQDLKMDSYL